jgi:hypothetical protein
MVVTLYVDEWRDRDKLIKLAQKIPILRAKNPNFENGGATPRYHSQNWDFP